MTSDVGSLVFALSITAAAGTTIIAIKNAVAHNPNATRCERCGCAQSEHQPEFGFGGACRCGHCPRFVLAGSWWTR